MSVRTGRKGHGLCDFAKGKCRTSGYGASVSHAHCDRVMKGFSVVMWLAKTSAGISTDGL